MTPQLMTLPRLTPGMVGSFRGPWAITHAGADELRAAIVSGAQSSFREIMATIDRPRLEARTRHRQVKGMLWEEDEEYFDPRIDAHIRASGVGVLPVRTAIMTVGDWCYQGWDQIIAACEEFAAEFVARQQLQDVPDLQCVVMPIDSPGGMCVGMWEACAAIRALRELVPVYTVADFYVGSAAEVIACQGTESYCSRDSQRGHLGTWTAHLDISAMLAKDGISVEFFEAPDPAQGGVKTFFASEKPLTENARAVYQEEIAHFYANLVEAVVLGRPGLEGKVDSLKAQIFSGTTSIDAGLCDGEATFDGLIATLEGR